MEGARVLLTIYGLPMYRFLSTCRTFRKDCPVELCLRASEDGMSLVVKRFNAEHNHAISRVSSLNILRTYYYRVMYIIFTLTVSVVFLR